MKSALEHWASTPAATGYPDTLKCCCVQGTERVSLSTEHYNKLFAALRKIACYDDTAANQRLVERGNYSSFDEPTSVATARTALEDYCRTCSKLKPLQSNGLYYCSDHP